MSDLIYLLNTLLDNKGQILIRGIMEDVASVTDEEVETYKNIDFDVEIMIFNPKKAQAT